MLLSDKRRQLDTVLGCQCAPDFPERLPVECDYLLPEPGSPQGILEWLALRISGSGVVERGGLRDIDVMGLACQRLDSQPLGERDDLPEYLFLFLCQLL